MEGATLGGHTLVSRATDAEGKMQPVAAELKRKKENFPARHRAVPSQRHDRLRRADQLRREQRSRTLEVGDVREISDKVRGVAISENQFVGNEEHAIRPEPAFQSGPFWTVSWEAANQKHITKISTFPDHPSPALLPRFFERLPC